MFVFGSNAKIHFGAELVDGVLGRSFAVASNTAGAMKTYAGAGVIRGESSTEDLATVAIEEVTPGGPKVLIFGLQDPPQPRCYR